MKQFVRTPALYQFIRQLPFHQPAHIVGFDRRQIRQAAKRAERRIAIMKPDVTEGFFVEVLLEGKLP